MEATSMRSASGKRFMAPSGRAVGGASPSLSHQPQTSANTASNINFTPGVRAASSTSRVSISGGRQQMHSQQPAPPSRYLVTVIPPEQLPHDPPHPRTSTFCSGYGPPSKFRRGTLVPLHSTLAGQVAAIAREYGLPSTGGIVLYLVELNQEQQTPLGDALLGGPRIGDEAWQLLWGQLFNPPQLEDYDQTSVSEEDDLYFGHYPTERHIPALPQLPMSLRPGQAAYETQVTSQTGDVRPVSPSEPQSDVSSLADNSSALASEELLGQQSMVSSNTSHVFSPPSSSTRQTKSSNTSASQGHETSIPSSPHVRPYSSASHARVRNKPRSSTRRPSHTNSRHNTSRHSIRSTRSYSQSNTSGEGPLYGEAVVVGKIEFDIDNRRGAGKWFDTWIQSASTQTSGESSPLESTQRSSRLVLSRHQPTASASGSLLRSRTLVSEIELPSRSGSASAQDYIQNVKQEAKATEQSSDNEHVLQASEVARPISQASSVLASQSNRDSISEADSVLSSSNENSVAIPQHTSPLTEDEASISLLHTDQSRSEGRPAVFESSKRASGASQGSLLSPAQIPISQRSSMEMESSNSGGNFQGLHSERSSSSSFGNEANIEAMNATPRISGPATFASRRSSVSSTPAPSVGVHNHKRQPSETSIASSSEPRSVIMEHQPSPPLSDTVDARKDTAISEDDAHSIPPSLTSSVYNSRRQSSSSQIEPEEQMVESSLTTETEAADQQASEAFSQHKQLHSRASSVSRASSASSEALDQEEQGYQALEDDEHPREGPQLSVEPANVDDWTAQTTATHRLATEEEDSNESTYEPSEMEDRIVTTEVDLTQGDPLKDIFPSDANTWTQIKYSHDLQEDSATESPAEETVQTALGLGISSSAMLQGHAIPPSASSSLDPFEYDDETGSTLNSPIGPPEDDVKEVADLLKASAAPAHFGLSSPINLGEPSKRLSKQSEPSSLNEPEAEVKQAPARRGHSRAPSQASLASSMRLSAQISSLSPPIDPAMIALPESDSNLSLSNMVSSSSSKSLASIASQPSIWEPETTFTESSKAANRDARLPPDWANQLFAMGNIRSRGNSVGTDAGEAEQVPNLSVANLPQLLSQLGDGTQSRASLASLYAQSARSRSSSVEMMNNLDEIERALAELSPRALKPALGDNARTPNLASFLKEAEKLESVPGYGKDSAAEDMAPITPRATPSDEESISNSVSEHSIQAGKSESSSRPASEASAEEDALTEEAPRSSSFSLASGNSGYMAPPLPLKIRTDRSESGSPNAFSDRSGPTPVAKAAELPPVGTPTLTQIGEQNVTSPGGESRASTTIPYDIPSVTNSPQQRVTFASEVQEHPDTPTAKAGMSSKFAAGLKLKAWSGKNSQKDNHSYSSQPKEAGSPGQAKEPAKSPLPGLKGFKWWQKEGNSHHDESSQKLATEISLPASPSASQQGEMPASILQRPNPPFSHAPRIPRKSSLASLNAAARTQDSLSPNLHNVQTMPLPVASPSSIASPQFVGGEYPSPPTHTSLPSPPRRPVRLPSFMPSYPPQFMVDDDERPEPTPPLIRNDSNTTQSTSAGVSPQAVPQGLAASSSYMIASASLPVLSDSAFRPQEKYPPSLQRTPEMGGNSHGTFLGQEGRTDGHTTSAPVTPVYAEKSLVPSSGRYGRPAKANPAKTNFRLSADADLSKMMNHMQAIEFGEDDGQSSSIPPVAEQGHVHPARMTPTRGNFGLGLGLPRPRKSLR